MCANTCNNNRSLSGALRLHDLKVLRNDKWHTLILYKDLQKP